MKPASAYLTFMPLIYKQGSTLWQPAGQNLKISCYLNILGYFGINMAGEEVPLPTTTIPPLSASPGTTYESQYALIQFGNVYYDTTFFADSNFKACIKVKDLATNLINYIDITSWNATFPAACNFVPEPSSCSIPTSLSAGTPGATTATITWVPEPGSVGVEWQNTTSATPPTTPGSFLDISVVSQALTGLTASTTYYFWIKTICGAGSTSAWTRVEYVTT